MGSNHVDSRNVELVGLLAAVASGNTLSFALLYQRTNRRLFTVIARICRNNTEAEDVLQDVYVRLWSRVTLFDATKGSAMGWLSTLARNQAIDATRARPAWLRNSVVVSDFDEYDPYFGIASPDPPPLVSVMRAQAMITFEACLQAFPDQQQQSIRLACHHGMSPSEIADKLNAPLSTVKSWLRRGAAKLAMDLEPYSLN